MNTCHATVSSTHLLNEQIAHQVFEILPEQGPVLLILDRDGTCWSSHPEESARLQLTETFLKDLRAKVDDGAEPVITQLGDASVTMAQLCTERTNCGYVVVVLGRFSPEAALANVDLVEALLHQVALIARLIEKTSMLVPSPVSHYAAWSTSTAASN
ncbi:MAG: hypothetical protein MUC88_15605 [Planctomycetes bacterium]|nr:hypothetical protein [Planctomycetota bacterium]